METEILRKAGVAVEFATKGDSQLAELNITEMNRLRERSDKLAALITNVIAKTEAIVNRSESEPVKKD